ncbi:hypothetical protein N0V90_008678 [Kalmusia sp. IMI 367209]|nr:hypothetical protein N0V90_008678 [Kalmusia sp. IMI 367209]
MAAHNVLLTGAAGYIGGSIVADFLTGIVPSLKKEAVFAAVRSEEQAEALSKSGANVIRLDLRDAEAIEKTISDHKISIIIHLASSLDPSPAVNMINALSKQREATGQQVYFIHTSGLSAFLEKTGWPSGTFHDTGNSVFETEKQLADSYALRKTDVTVIETAMAKDVTSFIVIPSHTYGKGTGAWNRLSVTVPILIKASIERKEVRQFEGIRQDSYVHISDLTALYGRIVEKILHGEDPPSGSNGYYFAIAHRLLSNEFADHLAATLHARGLVGSPKSEVWPSHEAAADALGVPAMFVDILFNSGDDMASKSGEKVDWQPKWDKERFLNNLNAEIDAVIELGKAKSSLIDSLFAAAKQ